MIKEEEISFSTIQRESGISRKTLVEDESCRSLVLNYKKLQEKEKNQQILDLIHLLKKERKKLSFNAIYKHTGLSRTYLNKPERKNWVLKEMGKQ